MAVIRIAAAAITNDAGQMLLVRKRGTRAFMQPGGKIDPGETPVDALVRELREELGLEIDERKLTFMGHFSAPAANEAGQTVDAQIYSMAYQGNVKAQSEIAELIWYPDDYADGMSLAPLTRDFVIPASGGGE